jgi:hypothetical protein
VILEEDFSTSISEYPYPHTCNQQMKIEMENGSVKISLNIRHTKFVEKYKKLSNFSSFWLTSCIFIFTFLFIMSFTMRNSYSSTIMNDGDTLLFLSFVKNLSNCGLQLTNGLMLNAVNNSCLPFISGGNYEFYRDHPTGSLAPYVLADKIIDLTILESRLMSVFITLAYTLILMWIMQRHWKVQFLPIIVFFSIPVLWYHSIVLHIFVQTAIMSLLTTYLFVKRLSKSFLTFIPILGLFAVSFLMDWAAFLLAIIVSTILFLRREFLNFSALVTLSILSYFLIRKWLESGSDRVGLHSGLGVFREQDFSFNSVLFASLQMGRSLGLGLIFILLGFLILVKDLRVRQITVIDAMSLILFLQGIMFVYLFINWSSGHSYWCYFLIPTAFIEGTRVLKWVKEKFPLKIYSRIVLVTLLSSLTYSTIWWYDDFIQKPTSYSSYFQRNNLPSEFLASETLYAYTANIMNGQGFKARLVLHDQIRNYAEYNYGDGGYFVTNTIAELRAFQLKAGPRYTAEPIFLNWFEWWVVKLP